MFLYVKITGTCRFLIFVISCTSLEISIINLPAGEREREHEGRKNEEHKE